MINIFQKVKKLLASMIIHLQTNQLNESQTIKMLKLIVQSNIK